MKPELSAGPTGHLGLHKRLSLLKAEVEVTVRLPYIICITRITFKFIHNALLLY